MERRRARLGARGGEDIQALLTSGARLATGIGSVACLSAVLAVPLVRGDETFQRAEVRVAAVAFVVLVAALVRGWPSLVPVAVALTGGAYAVELAVDDAPVDVAAPAVAVGLLLTAELAYWSLDERNRVRGDAGDGLRRAALVALGGVATVVVTGGLLVLVDAVRTHGLALDLLGALAAAAVLATLLVTRGHDRPSDEQAREDALS